MPRHLLRLFPLIALLLMLPACGRKLDPLISAHPNGDSASLPADTIILNLVRAANVEPPFALADDPVAVAGRALVLKEGDGSKGLTGRAVLELHAPLPGTYHVWAHVRWSDACGNSLGIAMDNQPDHVAVQDNVYNTWHWVRAGRFQLSAGRHRLILAEREDGVAIDQLILTRDDSFLPTRAVRPNASPREPRRFSDDFARSPGHGLDAWDFPAGKWEIAFSFDPNRIPHQYGLLGQAVGDAAVALLKEHPWSGCRLSFSLLPLKEGAYGAVLDYGRDGGQALFVGAEVGADGAKLRIEGHGSRLARPAGDAVRLNQWHRLTIERWGPVLSVAVDGEVMHRLFDLPPPGGHVGLYTTTSAVFDDVKLEEIVWQADNGRDHRMPWVVPDAARWYRPKEADAPEALIGRRGAISLEGPAMPLQELLLDEIPEAAGRCRISGPRLEPVEARGPVRLFRSMHSSDSVNKTIILGTATEEVAIRRIAVRYGTTSPEIYRIGPYDFTEDKFEAPSDYLDFTPEEYRKIAKSPDARKLERRPKLNPFLNTGTADYSPWVIRAGTWKLADGRLRGAGANALLRHAQEISGPFDLRLRFRLPKPEAAFQVQLYARPGPGVRVDVRTRAAPSPTRTSEGLFLLTPDDDRWHRLLIRTSQRSLSAKTDDRPLRNITTSWSDGARIFLSVPVGIVEFDDIEFLLHRRHPRGSFHAFDRRETNWWRDGGEWIDHGGVTCVFASSWVSLIAPDRRGMLWYKHPTGPDLLLAFEIAANTEWFGWDKTESHRHYPADNIVAQFAAETDPDKGYRLEVNAENRSKTILYRNGEPVAQVSQDAGFPIRYTGGHAPYSPRKSRICLIKRGPIIKAVINGKEVLAFKDPHPINTSRVGLGAYKTRVNFTNIEVISLN